MNAAFWPSLANHLWQSTVFAGLVWLLTLALRKNRARVRHSLWLAASYKFLFPLSLLVALGGHIPWRRATETTPSKDTGGDGRSQSAVYGSGDFVSGVGDAFAPYGALAGGSVGALGVRIPRYRGAWWIRWRRLRAIVRPGSLLNLEIPLPAVSSPALLEPGVFGIFRPVLVLPEGIVDRLTPAQLEAVIAHELCHVRHRDNLTAAIHMLVETAFWFHPLAWWIGKRMLEERERACDEEVLRLGCEPRAYAEGLLSICKLYAESPLVCVAGVTGGNLKRRIEEIMANRKLEGLNRAKTMLLAAAGVGALVVPILTGLVVGAGSAPVLLAQAPALPKTPAAPIQSGQAPAVSRPNPESRPQFDVVSVRRCLPGEEFTGPPGGRGGPGGGGGGRGPRFSPGRLRVQCLSVADMIRIAYLSVFGEGLLNYNAPPGDNTWLRNAPAWVNRDWYTVEGVTKDPVATGPTGPGHREAERVMEQMLQPVLEERFQLKIHRDTEEVAMYNLTVAKSGLKLKPMEKGGCTDRDPTQGVTVDQMFPPGKTQCA